MPCHALDRLQERYSADITFDDLTAMHQLVVAGEAKFVTTQPHGVAEYLVRYNGRRYRLVCAQDSKKIVTALPIKGRTKPRKHTIFRRGRKFNLD